MVFSTSVRNDLIPSYARASQAENDYSNDINTKCYQSIAMQLAVYIRNNNKKPFGS